MGALSGVDDLCDAGDPILQDAFESGFERDRRSRTCDTGAGEFHGDDARVLIDVMKYDIAVIGLDGRSDDFDDLLDLCAHTDSLGNMGPRTTFGR